MAAPKSFMLSDVCPSGPATADVTIKAKEDVLLGRIAELLGEVPGAWRQSTPAACSPSSCGSCSTGGCS